MLSSKSLGQRLALVISGASLALAPFVLHACELTLTEHRSGIEVLSLPVKERPIRFSVSFVHSVLQTPVEDFYEARYQDGRWKMYLVKELHQGQGYGLPYAATASGESYVHTDKGWLLTMNRLVDPLVQLPLPSQRITLHFQNKSVLLGSLSKYSMRIEVRDCQP